MYPGRFRVPLDTNKKRIVGPFNGFDDSVTGYGCNNKTWGKRFYGLMMLAVDPEGLRSEDLNEF